MKHKNQIFYLAFGILSVLLIPSVSLARQPENPMNHIRLKIACGHTAKQQTNRMIRFSGNLPGMQISSVRGDNLESNDKAGIESHILCGAGDVDEIIVDVQWPEPSAAPRQLPRTSMWKYLLKNGSPGQISRLQKDPWKQPDAPVITFFLNRDSTRGFSLGLDQLIQVGAMWLPRYDIFITRADHDITFAEHLKSLKGERTLKRIKNEPDASLDQFKDRWTDFGNPLVKDPSWEKWQTSWMETVGHLIVTAAANGSIYKFAIDRKGNVRPDFASPHKFRLDLSWEKSQWQKQKITDGLPIIETRFKKNNQLVSIEQFAAPLEDPDAVVYGYLPTLFFTKISFTGEDGPVNFDLFFGNDQRDRHPELKMTGRNEWILSDEKNGKILLMLETEKGIQIETGEKNTTAPDHLTHLRATGQIKNNESCNLIVKLPSPETASSQLKELAGLDYAKAKNEVVHYWEEWINRGAAFRVPEEEINALFRANLWHALVLPRHTLGTDNEFHMDIPYANTAYGQKDADWPINQAVYVDYMIYGLRGYEKTATDELISMFRTQQQADGRIGGFANWGVYSPGHLYAIAQNFLLSHNREQFERLLPNALKLIDWCLLELAKANIGTNKSGLIVAPLNDLSEKESEWAFTQAYFAGGLELFGRALNIYGHPRAEEVSRVAEQLKKDIEMAFTKSSVESPVVQLADGSWDNFVPTDALSPRRLLDQWYPSSVDTGPLHLPRLGAVNPSGWLTSAMLNDHEDNLFLDNLGAANEPVYIPQATVYLHRDQPKAAIRAFYSMTACAFSHNQLTPLEHRWGHPVYYSPPSTDGAWFETLRKLLINEIGYDTLFIGQAVPRQWLARDKKIEVKNAPTYFGPVSFDIEGINLNREITGHISLPERNLPKELRVRFRSPGALPMRSVRVNGKNWNNFNAKKEYIRIPHPAPGEYVITAVY